MAGVIVGVLVIIAGAIGIKYALAAIIFGITAITVGLGLRKD